MEILEEEKAARKEYMDKMVSLEERKVALLEKLVDKFTQ